jgi:hypothetical protein
MEQKKSTITAAIYSNEWKNPSGMSTFYYDVTLENGDRGSVGVTQKNSPKVAVGNEITYTLNGLKMKIVQSESSAPAQTGTKPYKRSGGSQDPYLGYAWSYAKDLIIAGKTMSDIEELDKVATYIHNRMTNMQQSNNNE